ncbi:MAG: hypothetical protein DI556_04250 [Rhodovulum sulfidophilum]|uniref:Uncharacterized protein n=1 Tax=Rhodovulum sulfidophilum TaxID=35806 RepID=A0A2W5Q282_RHOSU|nr:MAG: hypothetical protein DI556_04250 [Rhodovulum sulfidophilum]
MSQSQSQGQAGRDAPEFAVLTGDIIRSSKLSTETLDAAMAALEGGATSMTRWEGAEPARFERFRGDGWQCLAPSPRLALRATLFLRASLRAALRDVETRVSIGIGPARLSPETLAAAGGPAFELSGRGLDKMARARNLAISWANPPGAAPVIGAVVALCDEISRLWTPRQAELLLEALSPGDAPQEVLAERRGISQQAVAKHLRAGGGFALQEALRAVEGAL